jgi:hypothetical protein
MQPPPQWLLLLLKSMSTKTMMMSGLDCVSATRHRQRPFHRQRQRQQHLLQTLQRRS